MRVSEIERERWRGAEDNREREGGREGERERETRIYVLMYISPSLMMMQDLEGSNRTCSDVNDAAPGTHTRTVPHTHTYAHTHAHTQRTHATHTRNAHTHTYAHAHARCRTAVAKGTPTGLSPQGNPERRAFQIYIWDT